MSGNRHPL